MIALGEPWIRNIWTVYFNDVFLIDCQQDRAGPEHQNETAKIIFLQLHWNITKGWKLEGQNDESIENMKD